MAFDKSRAITPLPENVTAQIRGTWKSQIKDASGKPLY